MSVRGKKGWANVAMNWITIQTVYLRHQHNHTSQGCSKPWEWCNLGRTWHLATLLLTAGTCSAVPSPPNCMRIVPSTILTLLPPPPPPTFSCRSLDCQSFSVIRHTDMHDCKANTCEVSITISHKLSWVSQKPWKCCKHRLQEMLLQILPSNFPKPCFLNFEPFKYPMASS